MRRVVGTALVWVLTAMAGWACGSAAARDGAATEAYVADPGRFADRHREQTLTRRWAGTASADRHPGGADPADCGFARRGLFH